MKTKAVGRPGLPWGACRLLWSTRCGGRRGPSRSSLPGQPCHFLRTGPRMSSLRAWRQEAQGPGWARQVPQSLPPFSPCILLCRPSVCVCVAIPSPYDDPSPVAPRPAVGTSDLRMSRVRSTGALAFSIWFWETQISVSDLWNREETAESSSRIGGRKPGVCNVTDARRGSEEQPSDGRGQMRVTHGLWLWGHIPQHPVKPSAQRWGGSRSGGGEEQVQHRGFRAVRLLHVTLPWWTRVIVQSHQARPLTGAADCG